MPGAEAAGAWSVNLMALTGGRLYKWNPWTGAMTLNTSIGLATTENVTTGTYYKNSDGRGSDPSVLSIQTLVDRSVTSYRLIEWTTRGTSTNFTSRIASNTTYARSSLPSYIDWNIGLGATVAGVTVAGVFMGQNITGYRVRTGEVLWSKIINEPVYSGVCNIVDHGKVAVLIGSRILCSNRPSYRTRGLEEHQNGLSMGIHRIRRLQCNVCLRNAIQRSL